MAKHLRTSAVRASALPQRRKNFDRAAILTTLAIVSTAWTANLAGVGAAIESADEGPATLPDGTVLPTEAYKRPASYARPGTVSLGVPSGSGDRVVAAASTNGIPSAALSAYQRAQTVMNAADQACNIPWQLIAAIWRVESDHGRYGGNTLGVDGISRPGIFGIPLDGTRGTAEISDTDAGQYDNDAVWDRAVGPMQFIPSTWSVVGVDADGDAQRNPQDIDDAALAAAVYLCSGDDNLAEKPGQRKSVYRYNHSDEYVDLVLSIMDAYTAGDYTSVPNYITSAVTFTPDYDFTRPTLSGPKKHTSGAGTGTGAGGTQEPAKEPTKPTEEPAEEPADEPAKAADPVGQVQETVKQTTTAVTTLLTLPQAIVKCTTLGYNALLTPAAWNACITKLTTAP
jgi:membrane-bound lytic murein transglycosylase B